MLWTLAGALHAGFSALCVSLVAAFFLLVCTPVLHQPVRARLRPLALQEVEQVRMLARVHRRCSCSGWPAAVVPLACLLWS